MMGSGSHRSVRRAPTTTDARMACSGASSRWSGPVGTSGPVQPLLPVLPAVRHSVLAIMVLRAVEPVDPSVIRRPVPVTCVAGLFNSPFSCGAHIPIIYSRDPTHKKGQEEL